MECCKKIPYYTTSGVSYYELDTMTLQEMLDAGIIFTYHDFLHKVRVEYAKLYSGQTLLDKLLAISKKLKSGLNVFTQNVSLNSAYITLAKQYIQDAYDATDITEEQYNILYGIADSTKPA